MTEHMLVRDNPDRSGFRIVDDYHYRTRGRVFWSDTDTLEVWILGHGHVGFTGSMKLQQAYHWLKSQGIELANDHGFILSGYIIACEQQEKP